MKYFNFKFLTLFFALAMAIPPAWAEETITVCDGTATNWSVPIYGSGYCVQTSQMIYPASLLQDMSGTSITGITFYTSSNIVFTGGKFNVYLSETDQVSYSSTTPITSGLEKVVNDGSYTDGGTSLVIQFDTPYNYSGGNLLVEIEVTDPLYANYNTLNFYGESQTSYTAYYNNGYGYRIQFLPKATFTYEGELQPYAAKISPTSIDFGKTTPNTSLTQALTIKNNGANAFTPSLSGLNAPFSTTYSPAALLAGETATVPIVFNPTITGDFTATLAVTSTDGNIETVYIPLSGTCANEVPVGNGSTTNVYLPVYGNYFEEDQINQMVYPASMLTSLVGKKIKSMTFYLKSARELVWR